MRIGVLGLGFMGSTLVNTYSSGEPQDLLTPAQQSAREDAMGDFYAFIGENRQPFADILVAAAAALTTIMGRTAMYERRMVNWKELGVSV